MEREGGVVTSIENGFLLESGEVLFDFDLQFFPHIARMVWTYDFRLVQRLKHILEEVEESPLERPLLSETA